MSEATLAGKAPAGLPLRLDGRTIGALVLHASEAHAIDDEEMKLLAQLAGDISFGLEYLSKKERLDYFSFYDTLTGLPNRTLYADRINQTLQAHSSARGKLAVVLLDIERFSFINESLGRQAGDELLKRVGSALDETLGPMGGVARVGADTFAIGIVEVREDADIARILEEQIAGALGRPFSVEHQDLRIAFKCGVAMHPGDGDDAESLLRNAETALKNAKSKGERYLFYATAMNAHVADVLALENQLRIAIVEDQFVLHYQPKVNVRTRRVYGVEALIRWQQPGGMLVPPSSFVPILEDTGMIVDVGMWVLRQAARDQRHWLLTHGCAPRISVNVSSLQLRQKRFVEDAVEAIRSEGGDASMIDLEITETVIMENIAQYIPKLKALRAHGMGIEIDDFGTGYASLAYLGKLPVTALKIDRSFVTAMTTTVEDQTITSTIISLANLLKLSVVAEGVETEEQREMLQALDCENMQGYLFSRPVPAAEIERLYLGRRSPADCSPSAAGACQPPLKDRASCNGR